MLCLCLLFQGERLSSIKERVKNRLDVPDREFEKVSMLKSHVSHALCAECKNLIYFYFSGNLPFFKQQLHLNIFLKVSINTVCLCVRMYAQKIFFLQKTMIPFISFSSISASQKVITPYCACEHFNIALWVSDLQAFTSQDKGCHGLALTI